MNLDKIIKISVKGRNIERYLKRIIKNNINYIKVIVIDDSEINMVLRYNDYLELIKYKTILYKVEIIDKVGILKLSEKLNNNKILIIFMILGLGLLYGLSNVIFNVKVIHHDKNVRELVYNELKNNSITRFSFKKSYLELEKIEDRILSNNKDKLEWLEIVVNGTFVSVKVEERIINDKKDNYKYQSIIAKKNAVIDEIKANRGEVLKEKGMYVKKGEVIISGYVKHPDNTSGLTMGDGSVYGEVWYEVDIDYPFVYQESNVTGKSKNGLVIKFFNKEFNLFGKGDYRSFSRKNKVLFKDNLLNLKVIKEKRYELDIRDEVYTAELVEGKAISYVKEKMIKDNSDIKEIVKIKVISREVDYDSIRFNFFVTTIEDIGESVEIGSDEKVS